MDRCTKIGTFIHFITKISLSHLTINQGAKYPLVKVLTALSQNVNSNIVIQTDKRIII